MLFHSGLTAIDLRFMFHLILDALLTLETVADGLILR